MKISRSPVLVSTAHVQACAPLLPSESPLPRRARQRMLGSLMALTGVFAMTGCMADTDRDLGADEDIEETTQALTASTSATMRIVAKNSNLCLDAWDASSADGALVKQGTCHTGTNQKLKLVPVGDSYYNLVFEHSQKCLDVSGLSTADGANLWQWTCTGGDNQKFRVVDNYDGYHWLVAKNSGKCVDVSGASSANGAQIWQWTCHGGANQKFKLEGREFYNVKPVHSGLCLDVPGASMASGVALMQGNCNGGDNQRFDLYLQPNGYYRIVNKNSGKCVDVDHAYTVDGASVIQSDCHSGPNGDGDNQMFQVTEVSPGRYKFVAKHSGKCLDVYYASTANEALIKQSTCNGGTNQQFTLDELAPPEGTPSLHAISSTSYTNFVGLKQAVATDPTITYNLAMLAHMFGFGWAGGTQGNTVGQGFEVTPVGDNYVLQARYNSNDAYAGGYRASERLKITLSDFRTLIDPASFVYGKAKITEMVPLALSTYTVNNWTTDPVTMTKDFSFTLDTSISHETNASFTSTFNLSIENKAKIPFLGESTVTTEFGFSKTNGYVDTTETTESIGDSDGATVTVPAGYSQQLVLEALRTSSQVDYTASAIVSFTVSFTGFLRTSDNARSDHPTDRPTVTLTFGNKDAGVSGLEDIIAKHDSTDSAAKAGWDWNWAKTTHGATMRNVMRFNRGDIGVQLNGRFTQVKGHTTHIDIRAPQRLSTP